jgi:CO/xanthine dehydrogenase FAD-binding subunit
VKPAPFEYHRATTLDDALALLAAHAEAKPLAGGQSLIPAMNFRLAQPAALVDLNGVTELSGIGIGAAGALRIGAMTRHSTVERSDVVAHAAPLLAEAMPHVAHPQIRNRGTLGGSLAHADPGAELPAVMLALDATFILRRTAGERRVPAAAFFTGLFATALEPGELLVAVEIPPRAPRSGSAFLEMARRHGDYALAGVAADVSLDGNGRVAKLSVALLSLDDKPISTRAADILLGEHPSPKLLAAAADAVREAVNPPSDIHADERYRRQLAGVLTARALGLCVERATASTQETS